MIKKLSTEHLHFIREIARESFSLLWTPSNFSFFLTHPHSFSFGFFENDENLSSYLLALLICGELDICSIATRKNKRRKGFAWDLLSYVISHPNVKKVTLEVSSKNENAISFYKKFGFIVGGYRKAYYSNGEDALVMCYSKSLDTLESFPSRMPHQIEMLC